MKALKYFIQTLWEIVVRICRLSRRRKELCDEMLHGTYLLHCACARSSWTGKPSSLECHAVTSYCRFIKTKFLSLQVGRVYHPQVNEWQSSSSNLISLKQIVFCVISVVHLIPTSIEFVLGPSKCSLEILEYNLCYGIWAVYIKIDECHHC
jgi:hypothetical protein